MDELFEAMTLVQTRKIEAFPVVLMGTDYWAPLLDFLRGTLVRQGTISAEDLDLLTPTDSPEEMAHVVYRALEANRTAIAGRPRRRRLLGER
jgi:predicted Rossmann-fold nucleotide-binding protein